MHPAGLGRTTPAAELIRVTTYPAPGEERPPAVTGACAPTDVLGSWLVEALLDHVLRYGTEVDLPDAPAHSMREEIHTALVCALNPTQIHTSVQVCAIGVGRTAGWGTMPADPLPCTADGVGGWQTGLRLVVPLHVPPGVRWSLHAPSGDVLLGLPGSVAFVGPRVPYTLAHPGLAQPIIWLAGRSTMRFPRRWSLPDGWAEPDPG